MDIVSAGLSRPRSACCQAIVPALVLLACLVATDVGAQTAAGRLAFYFDRSAETSGQEIAEFTPFQVYLLAVFRPGEASGARLDGWEASIDVDPRVTVTQRTLTPGALNIPPSGLDDDFFVGMGGNALSTSSSPLVLATYDCILLQPGVDTAALLVSSRNVVSRDDFEQPIRGPAWLDQVAQKILPFDSRGAAVVNPDPESWGKIKERFGGR